MTIRSIRTDEDLAATRAEITWLLDLNPVTGSDDFDCLKVLLTLATSYEAAGEALRTDPIEAIWQAMGASGISVRLLAAITCIPEPELAEILARRRALDVAVMRVLGPALGLSLDTLMQMAGSAEM